jgi:uncharacterized membrane protein
MWLSLVERSVRDREVVGSNPAIPTIRTCTAGRARGLPFGYLGGRRVLQSFTHWLGFGLCHQLPERSFFGGGVQLPVCTRDTGIYVGFCVSLALIALLHRPQRPREFPSVWGWIAFALMVGSMAVDGGTENLGLRSTTNELRLITGLLCGYAIGMLLTPMLNDGLWRASHPVRVLDPPWRLLLWLATVPIAYVAVWWGGPLLGIGYPILASAAVLVTLTSVNLVMVCLVPRFERRAARLRDAWLAILIALGMSILEVWLSGLLRHALVALAGRIS